MSEVKRYMENCGEGGGVVEHRNGDLISIKDFDRVTAEHDAALGREKECQRQLGERWKDIEALRSSLESAGADKEAYGQNAIDLRKRVDALQQRLTAADERWDRLETLTNDDLIAIARHAALNSVHRYNYMPCLPEEANNWEPHYWVIKAMRAALKPAERTNTSGKAHCPHDGICHTSNETCAQAMARVAQIDPAEGGGDA